MKHFNRLRRSTTVVIAMFLAIAGLLPVLKFGVVHAYGLVTTRSITLSSDSNAASTATTTYSVSFNAATSAVVGGMVVDFCSNDPIIGDTCTAPTGFTVGASPTIGAVTTTGQTGLTWSAASANSGRTLELTTTGSVSGSVASGANINFTITNVQNPTSAVGTYYARIFTFNLTGSVATWADTANGSSTANVQDAGGIALSTAQSITVTAKVQEQLSFCLGTTTLPTSGAAATAQTSCTNLSNSSVALGNNLGVLSSTGPYVDVSTQYIVGTNAGGGAAIVLKGATLTSGSNTIPGMAIGASSTGTSQFGLCTYSGTGSNLVFTNETNTAYNNTGCTSTNLVQSAGYSSTGTIGSTGAVPHFALNTTYTGATSGDPFALENAGSNSTGIIVMLGNISGTQTAGIYTTTLSLIATGTY